MENELITISRDELENIKRDIEGLKSTLEIMQNKEMMQDIRETNEALKNGEELEKVNF